LEIVTRPFEDPPRLPTLLDEVQPEQDWVFAPEEREPVDAETNV
jgi:hypothetical protein